MFAQQNKLKELFPKYGWELVETQIPDYFWIAEIWLLKSIWSPTDCNVFISFEVDPMTESRTEKWKHVWAVNLSLKQPYYWQSDNLINDVQETQRLQTSIRPDFEKYIPEVFDSLNDLRLQVKELIETADAREQNRKIWGKIKGAEKLFELYGYFPTLHDARIRKVRLDFENRDFYLTVDYSDLVESFEKGIKTRFTICWRNTVKADFNWYAEDLFGMTFSKENEFIKTKFTDYPFGFDGEIIASEIEIADIEIESEETNSEETLKFEIR